MTSKGQVPCEAEVKLVDWSWGTAVSLRDKAGIDAYLHEMTREDEGIDQIQ